MAEVKQWTVKGVEDRTRNAFILAARAANLNMGEWLNKYGEALVQAFMDGRKPEFPQGNAVVPTGHTQETGPLQIGHDPLPELVRLAHEASPPGKDTRALRAARGVVERRIKALEA